MEHVACILCGADDARVLFSKRSGDGELFTVIRCRSCGLRYVSPRPDASEMVRYYGAGYFMNRTERGYDNYFSGSVRGEIERVFRMNLHDLGFFEFEKGLGEGRSCLDIGCAAGYFVDFMKRRGWNSSGIDVSKECVDFAVSAGLDVRQGDYLSAKYARPFDCVTLWASIEHLHQPHLFLEKIHDELAPGGMLYLSTCRAGGMNFMRLYGRDWRFYNLPEHLYYFSRANMHELLARSGFDVEGYRTYGSGFAGSGSAARRIADRMAKHLYMGDMMILAARRKQGHF